MKHFIILIFLFIAISASAQHIPTKYEAPQRMNVRQIDFLDSSTLVFMDYTTPEDSTWQEGGHQWMNFSDKTYVSVPGSSRRFNMISTANMPVDSEAERKKMLFDHAGQRHQFVLEFEKLPEECSQFDIVESEEKVDAQNIRNITFDRNDTVPLINIGEFIADYPVKEYGQYYVNGTEVTYVKHKGIIVSSVPKYLNQYGKYVSVNICVQNFRDRSVLFNPENLSAIGYTHPKKKKQKQKSKDLEDDIYAVRQVKIGYNEEDFDQTVSVPFVAEALTYEEYDKIVNKKQKWNSFWYELCQSLATIGAGYSSSAAQYYAVSNSSAEATAFGSVGRTYAYSRSRGSSYTTSFGQMYASSYNGLSQYLADQIASAKIEDFNYEQRQIRSQIGEGYVKKHTIPSETEYSGFFNIKYKSKMHGLTYTIVIDGEPYTFYF